MKVRTSAKRPAKQLPRWKRRLKIAFHISFVLGAIAFIAISVVAVQRLQKAAEMVPKLPEIMEGLRNRPSTIVSSDGTILYSQQENYRKAVKRSEIPENVVSAILAAEDKRFYDHGGIDPIALARILFVAAKEGDASQGGSTLTMQVAKRVFTGDSPTIERKLDNMALAVQIERILTKDQILELYANESYFGERAYGIAAAADVYFGKTLDELTISEAATLARCVRRPSQENPVRNLDKALRNRNTVLRIMRDEKFITEAEYTTARAEELKVRPDRPRTISGEKKAPYFVDYVLAQLEKEGVDISTGGYRVVTTINLKYQEIADKGVSKWVDRLRGYRVNQMACLVTDSQGRILAMVGGPDYKKSQFNMIWMPPGRQPGSSFKPFVYAAGLERGAFSSNSTISTKAMKKPGTNEYFKGGANRGRVTIASALASSNNTAAVRAMDEVGSGNVVEFCRTKLGLRQSNLPSVISLALGSGEAYMTELASAYGVFQSHGTRYPTYAISRITLPDGTEKPMAPRAIRGAVSEETAEYIDLSLRSTVTSGTARAAGGVRNARGKTGTTSDHKDAWFCGYTDKLVGIVWTANEQIVDGRPVATPMRGLFGGEGPARVWNDIIGDIQDEIGEKSRSFGSMPRVDREEEPEEEPEEEIPVETPEQPEDPIDPGMIDDPAIQPDQTVPPPAQGTTGEGGTDGSSGGGAGPGEPELVYVSVCADSGQRANSYCPEAVRRPFRKGDEPRGSCPLHGRRAQANPTWRNGWPVTLNFAALVREGIALATCRH